MQWTMRISQQRGSLIRLSAFFIIIVLVSACSVPKQMRVRSGIDPRNQDDHVRFRTTYYFRVFDMCADASKTENPMIDSLYRFRMTGKASGLFSKVRFEAGTLKKQEIEPFGADVVYDEKLGRFRFVSREKTEAQAEKEARYAEIDRRLSLYENIKKMGLNEDATGAIQNKIQTSVEALIDQLEGVQTTQTNSNNTFGQSASVEKPKGSCKKIMRGFQIFGPEGVRTFDQDERLVMAMNSSGKPLIGAMKELAGRVLNEQPTDGQNLLPLVEEQLLIIQAERKLDQIENALPGESEPIVPAILKTFEEKK